MTTETPAVLKPLDHNVHSEQLVGWLSAAMEAEGVITAEEWNKAIRTLTRKA